MKKDILNRKHSEKNNFNSHLDDLLPPSQIGKLNKNANNNNFQQQITLTSPNTINTLNTLNTINSSYSPRNNYENNNNNHSEFLTLNTEGNINGNYKSKKQEHLNKLKDSFERLTYDMINNSNSNNNNNNFTNKKNNSNYQSNSNLINFTSPSINNNNNNKSQAYSDLFQQQESKMNNLKKNSLIKISDQNLNLNLKNQNFLIENNKKYNSILTENPEIKEKLNLKNYQNKYSNNEIQDGINNFGLFPLDKNKNNSREFFDEKNFNGKNESRKSLKNLNVVKNQLENLFEKNCKEKNFYFSSSNNNKGNDNGNDFGYSSNSNSFNFKKNSINENNNNNNDTKNAMEDLSKYLDMRNRRNNKNYMNRNGNDNSKNNRSFKLMTEINDIR